MMTLDHPNEVDARFYDIDNAFVTRVKSWWSGKSPELAETLTRGALTGHTEIYEASRPDL
jgi:hypothetical protein